MYICKTMRKKHIRFLFKELKKYDRIVSWKYVNNLRIFKTNKLTIVIVNHLRAESFAVYYYYMPDKTYLSLDYYRMVNYRDYMVYYNKIIREIIKIEDDEFYRQYRVLREANRSERIEK